METFYDLKVSMRIIFIYTSFMSLRGAERRGNRRLAEPFLKPGIATPPASARNDKCPLPYGHSIRSLPD